MNIETRSDITGAAPADSRWTAIGARRPRGTPGVHRAVDGVAVPAVGSIKVLSVSTSSPRLPH